MADPKVVRRMARFGVPTKNALGIPAAKVHALAREIGRNHRLAEQLWRAGLHEARALAALIDDPKLTSERQMERWVRDFDSWDICDCCCWHLFDRTPFAYRKARDWSRRKEEYVKRAGFSLMAALAVHDKSTGDAPFLHLLPVIERGSSDGRNFVKKAVNWALRQMGKRNRRLNRAAIAAARRIRGLKSSSARWIAADALRELASPAVQKRLRRGNKPPAAL